MSNTKTTHNITALFGGIGGLELGMKRSGHEATLFCECDPEAVSVLQERFPGVPVTLDVRETSSLLSSVSPSSDLLTAGFPCTDFSQAGTTKGFSGGRSSLIIDALNLLKQRRFQNVLLENVPNWRQLHKGAYLRYVVDELETMGYRWAYRTLDARAFGLPQRRLRLFLFATLEGDPREVLFHGDCPPSQNTFGLREAAHGFYWTEGKSGLGWGEDCVPTLKGGSSVSIPSPPAILIENGWVITPDIRDCERLQGFPIDWTGLGERCSLVGGGTFKQRKRWLLVGNSINVEVAHWIGSQLSQRAPVELDRGAELTSDAAWPAAAWFDGQRRFAVPLGTWPVARHAQPLSRFLRFAGQPLSIRATKGFQKRILASTLRFRPGFVNAIGRHLERMELGESVGGIEDVISYAA